MTDGHVDESRDGLDATSPRWRDDVWRSRRDPLVLAFVGVTFWAAGGLPGLGAAALLAVTWTVLPNVAVFVAGQIALVALVPAEASLATKALPAAALVGLLATTTGTDEFRGDTLALLGTLAVLLLVAFVAYSLSGLIWLTVAAVIVASVVGFVTLDLIALTRLGERIDE